LDLVEDHKKIDWVGNCNELNASYAADGYARVMHGSGGAAKHGSVGAILTTFGVGELSAMNGLAGAFSEHVPVVHIVGVPSTEQHKNKPMLHHTLGDGRFDAYLKAAKQVTYSHGGVFDVATAANEIDRVLTDCITSARPVYLMLPTDRVYNKIPRARLNIPLKSNPKPNDSHTEEFVLGEIRKLVEAAGSEVVILVDACTIRHDVTEETWDLIERTGFPVYSTPMGKTAVPEDSERYGGIYVGSISHPEIKEKVESAKLIISIGALKSDFNTGNFTYRTSRSTTVEVNYLVWHFQVY